MEAETPTSITQMQLHCPDGPHSKQYNRIKICMSLELAGRAIILYLLPAGEQFYEHLNFTRCQA